MKFFGTSIAPILLSSLSVQQANGSNFGRHHQLAFSMPRRRAKQVVQQKQVSQQGQQSNPSLEDLAVQQSSQQSTGQTSLQFQASTNYATDPLSSTLSPATLQNQVANFLFQDENRDSILAGVGSKNPVQVLHQPDIELYRLWQVETSRQPHLATPSIGDAILKVTTTGIHFPGLTLKTVATVGCKEVQAPNHAALEITLIQDELQAEGPEPLVWVFQQLTGTGPKNNDNKSNGIFPPIPFSLLRGNNPRGDTRSNQGNNQERLTHSTNIITAECSTIKDDDGKEVSSVIFRSVAKLSINVSFPSFLLRILPVSKQMAESQGSDAIHRVVTRDIGPSLEALKKKYENEIMNIDKQE